MPFPVLKHVCITFLFVVVWKKPDFSVGHLRAQTTTSMYGTSPKGLNDCMMVLKQINIYFYRNYYHCTPIKK